MKKYITIRKSNNKVEMISDKKIIVDENIFDQKQIDITPTKLAELDNSYEIYYTDKFELKENPDTTKQKEINNIKNKIEQATDIDKLKNEILNLINLIK